jgi:hypothetical protein
MIYKVLAIGLFLFCSVFFAHQSFASVNYVQNFDSCAAGSLDQSPCNIFFSGNPAWYLNNYFRISQNSDGTPCGNCYSGTKCLCSFDGNGYPGLMQYTMSAYTVYKGTMSFEFRHSGFYPTSWQQGIAIGYNGSSPIVISFDSSGEMYCNGITVGWMPDDSSYHLVTVKFDYTALTFSCSIDAGVDHSGGPILPAVGINDLAIYQSGNYQSFYTIDDLTLADAPPPIAPKPFSFYGIFIPGGQKTCANDPKLTIQQTLFAEYYTDYPSADLYQDKVIDTGWTGTSTHCNASTPIATTRGFNYHTPAGTIPLATTTPGFDTLCMAYFQVDDMPGYTYGSTTIDVESATSTFCNGSSLSNGLPSAASWCVSSSVCAGDATSTSFFSGFSCGAKLALCWAFAPTPSSLNFISDNVKQAQKVVPFVYFFSLANDVTAGMSSSSTSTMSGSVGLPMWKGSTRKFYIIPMINSSSVSSTIGYANAKELYDDEGYVIWICVGILIITMLIVIIPRLL